MKEWFIGLKAVWQVLLIILFMAFLITLIYATLDIEVAKMFINLVLKTVEGICQHLTYQL